MNLGSQLRKSGINALHFTYRGTWKSEGTFTHLTSLADVGSAIAFLKSPKVAKIRKLMTELLLPLVPYSPVLKKLTRGKRLDFLTGSLSDPAEKKLFDWGVRGWPWLTLTDSEHVVQAEGFSLRALQDKLAELAARE